MNRAPKITLFFQFLLWTFLAEAATPPQQVLLETMSVRPVRPLESLTSEKVARVIPVNLRPGAPEQEIQLQVLDHSVNNFVQGDYFRDSEIGRTATAVENATKVDVGFGKNDDGSIAHKLNMQWQAFQQFAELKYEGLLNMGVIYRLASQTYEITVNKPLGRVSSLQLQHVSANQSSAMSFQLAW